MPAALRPILDQFLMELTEQVPACVFASVHPSDAQAILDATPQGNFRDALRDAFRDNNEGNFN